MTDEQRYRLAEFAALQYLRTPEARQMFLDLQRSMVTGLLRKFYGLSEAYVEFDKRRELLDHAQMIFNPDLRSELSLTLANHIWIFGENTTDQDLYTSDAPVVKRAHIKYPHMGVGLGSEGIEVALPLTSRYILSMYDRTVFSKLVQLEERTIPLASEHVDYCNSLQVLQSYRSVYSRSAQFLFAVEVCADQPEICLPERMRVQTL